jgi:hypothetical protein
VVTVSKEKALFPLNLPPYIHIHIWGNQKFNLKAKNTSTRREKHMTCSIVDEVCNDHPAWLAPVEYKSEKLALLMPAQ